MVHAMQFVVLHAPEILHHAAMKKICAIQRKICKKL